MSVTIPKSQTRTNEPTKDKSTHRAMAKKKANNFVFTAKEFWSQQRANRPKSENL